MENDLEYIGYWKFPEDKEWRLPGKLKLNSKGVFLEVIGTLGGSEGINKIIPIIIGKTNMGDVTLVNSANYKGFYSVVSSEVYKCAYCFVGKHFYKLENIFFTTSAVRYQHLDNWAGIHGFKTKSPTVSNNKRGKKYTIEYTQPNQIEIFKNKDFRIFLFFSVTQNFASKFNRSGKISEKVYFNFYFNKAVNFLEVEKIIYSVKMFLTIALCNKTNITEVDLWIDTPKGEKIKLYTSEILQELQSTTIHESEMLFSLQDIKKNIKSILRAWFRKENILEPVYELYYDILYNEKRYGKTEFLNLIFAIETLHRRTRNNEIVNKEDFEIIVNKIESALSTKEQKLFLEKLKYINHLSLRSRLKSLFDEFSYVFEQFGTNRNSFINSIVDTRNYYVHFDQGLKNKIITSQDLNYYNLLLKMLLDISILSDIGIAKEDNIRLIKKSYLQKIFGLKSLQ